MVVSKNMSSYRESMWTLIFSLFHNTRNMVCPWNQKAADVKQMERFSEILINLSNSMTLDITEVNSLNPGK